MCKCISSDEYQDITLSHFLQSGFRLKHSTDTALIKIIDDLIFNLDNDRVSGMVLVDYLKAFDMIDHTLLLKKLEVYGLNRDSLQWLQTVKCRYCLSWYSPGIHTWPLVIYRLYR